MPEGGIDYIESAKKLINSNHGTIHIGMADLKNRDGYRYIDESGKIHPASIIKCFILEYAYLSIHAGNVGLNDDLGGKTLRNRLNLMIQISCNDSTAYVISHFGRANIDKWLVENYKHTRLYSNFRGTNFEDKENSSSVEDTIDFLERLYRNAHEEPYKSMWYTMLGTTFSRAKIPAGVSGFPNVRVANKSGSFNSTLTADHDMGIVIRWGSDGKVEIAYALVFYSFSKENATTFSAARPAIVSMSKYIFELIS